MSKKITMVLDYQIETYEIAPPIGNIFGWGAKVVIYLRLGETIKSQEFWGRTKEEVYERAKNEALDIIEVEEKNRLDIPTTRIQAPSKKN